MSEVMFRTARSVTDEVRAELRRLPVDHTSFQLEGAWLVVGPTGIFVVSPAQEDAATAGRRAVRRAEEIRDRLAQHMPWVPFVDALVAVSHGHRADDTPCVALDVALLRSALTEGPRTVDDDTLATLARLQFPRVA